MVPMSETPPTSLADSGPATNERSYEPRTRHMAIAEAPVETHGARVHHDYVNFNDSTSGSKYTGSSSAEHNDERGLNDGHHKPQECGVVPYEEEDEDELSTLEYARYHGLTTGYFNEDPLQHVVLPSLHGSLQSEFEDPQATLNIALLVSLGALKGHNMHEKWEVDKDAAKFLASLLECGKEGARHDEFNIDGTRSFRHLKLEEPILATDPGLDLLRLKRRNNVSVSTIGMEPFQLDEKQNEDPTWTAKEFEVLVETNRKVMQEKLDIDREAMEFLKRISTAPCVTENELTEALLNEHVVWRITLCLTPSADRDQVRFPKATSPPLMPLSPPIRPSGLSAAAGEMQLTSTPEDLIANEAAEVEQQILERDKTPSRQHATKPEPNGFDTHATSIYSPLQSAIGVSSSPLSRKRLQDLKADVPLTPREISEPPVKKAKTVSFPDELHTMIPAPDSDMSILDPQIAELDLDSFIANVGEPLANSVLQQLGNEELVELDTTMRVRVPQIEEVELQLPWNSVGHRESMDSRTVVSETTLLQMKRELLKGETSWAGVSKTERQLPWSPFPARLGKVEGEETFDDEPLARYMAELAVDDHIDISSLIASPLVVKIMDSDEEELLLEPLAVDSEEPQQPSPSTDIPVVSPQKQPIILDVAAAEPVHGPGSVRLCMRALLMKRKLELEAANKMKTQPTQPHQGDHQASPAVKANDKSLTKPTRFFDLVNNVGGISSFLDIHRGLSLEHSVLKRPLQTYQQPAPPAIMIESNGQHVTDPEEQHMSLPAPTLEIVARPAPIIVSSGLLAMRGLVRHIQHALPTLELFERDGLPTPSTSLGEKQNKSHDADITVSPSTGIVITTLQKLKQKPLPGQLAFFGAQERIAFVSVRYARLIVLVSEARATSDDDPSVTGAIDDRDTEALSDMIGFAATLDCDVEVYYVAGGDAELAGWIAAAISHNTMVDESTALLQDETLWERFLRSAGLNPSAAQNILATLKQSDATTDCENSSMSQGSGLVTYGLSALMTMTNTQRMEIFSSCIGAKVLARLGEIIESKWLSTADRAM